MRRLGGGGRASTKGGVGAPALLEGHVAMRPQMGAIVGTRLSTVAWVLVAGVVGLAMARAEVYVAVRAGLHVAQV
jgi:hypothetical protein